MAGKAAKQFLPCLIYGGHVLEKNDQWLSTALDMQTTCLGHLHIITGQFPFNDYKAA